MHTCTTHRYMYESYGVHMSCVCHVINFFYMHIYSCKTKFYLRQKKKDGGVPPVLDSLDNYKILSEKMNVLTIYLPWGN